MLEVLDTLKTGGVEDRIRVAVQTIYQAVIDAELSAVIGAGPWERTEVRTARKSSRTRTLSTPARDLE